MSTAQSRQLEGAGWALLRIGNARGAVRRFSEALTADPNNPDALAGLARCHMDLDQLDNADRSIRTLLRVRPNSATGHRLRAELLCRRKSLVEAVEVAIHAVSLNPREPLGYHVLGLCHEARKCFKGALNVCDEGIALTPGFAPLHAQRGHILLQLRGPKAAEASIEAALKLAPDSSFVLRRAATLALACNDLSRARDLLSIVLRRNANDREGVTLYLLTDPKRHRVLRWAFIFRYWRKGHLILGTLSWLAMWIIFLVIAIPLAILTHVGGLAIALCFRSFIQSRYKAHRKEVEAHFEAFALGQEF